jgi:hypothetical protein
MPGPVIEIRKMLGLGTSGWPEFIERLERCDRITLSILTNKMLELVGTCDDPVSWDHTFFLIGQAKKGKLRERIQRSSKLKKLDQMQPRLEQISRFLLRGETDTNLSRAFTAIVSDLGDLHRIYKEIKSQRLNSMSSKKVSEKGSLNLLESIDLDENVESPKVLTFDERAARKLGKKPRDKYANLKRKDDMRSVIITLGNRQSWVEALVGLTIFRKQMQARNLKQIMHFEQEETKMHHAFTQIFFGSVSTCVYVHNTKNARGQGAPRVISFVDKAGKVFCPDLAKMEADDLSWLDIVDISYPDLFGLLDEIVVRFLGGDEVKLAKALLAILEGGQPEDLQCVATIFDKPLLYQPKVKQVFDTGKIVEKKVEVPVLCACTTALAILFLTEPKHAMPLWISNRDALSCMAKGYLTLQDLMYPKISLFGTGKDRSATVKLDPDAEVSIGWLLASANTAGQVMDVGNAHTRMIKDMIMPATELIFKHGGLNSMKLILDKMTTTYQQQNGTDGPWILDEEFENEELLKVRESKSKLDKTPKSGKLYQEWEHAIEVYRGGIVRTVDVRKLTFVIPVAKILLLREIQMNS